MVWKSLHTEEVTQCWGDAERIKAWESLPIEDASQHRGKAERTNAWKRPKTGEVTQRRGEAGQTTEQLKVFTKKLSPTLPPVGAKTCPAGEGGARPQVKHPPVLALELNPTAPFHACPQDETLIAAKT